MGAKYDNQYHLYSKWLGLWVSSGCSSRVKALTAHASGPGYNPKQQGFFYFLYSVTPSNTAALNNMTYSYCHIIVLNTHYGLDNILVQWNLY